MRTRKLSDFNIFGRHDHFLKMSKKKRIKNCGCHLVVNQPQSACRWPEAKLVLKNLPLLVIRHGIIGIVIDAIIRYLADGWWGWRFHHSHWRESPGGGHWGMNSGWAGVYQRIASLLLDEH